MPTHGPRGNPHNRQDTAAGRAKKRKSAGRAPTTRAGKRQDTVAGRATKRRSGATTPVTRPVASTNVRQRAPGRRTPSTRRKRPRPSRIG